MPAPKWLTRPLWAGSGLQVSIASMSAQADQETFELCTLSRQLTPNCTKTSSVHVDYSHIENQRSFVLIQNPQIYSGM